MWHANRKKQSPRLKPALRSTIVKSDNEEPCFSSIQAFTVPPRLLALFEMLEEGVAPRPSPRQSESLTRMAREPAVHWDPIQKEKILVVLDLAYLLGETENEGPDQVRSANLSGKQLCSVAGNVGVCTNLTKLDLDDNRLQLESIRPFVALRHLSLCCNGIVDVNLSEEVLPNLENLGLAFNNLTASAITNLMMLPNLRQLDLSSNDLKLMPETAKFMTKLEILALEHNSLGSDCIAVVASLPRLWLLNMNHNFVTSVPHQAANGFVAIEILQLAHNNIAKESKISPLLQLKTLRELHLWGNPMSAKIEGNNVKYQFSEAGIKIIGQTEIVEYLKNMEALWQSKTPLENSHMSSPSSSNDISTFTHQYHTPKAKKAHKERQNLRKQRPNTEASLLGLPQLSAGTNSWLSTISTRNRRPLTVGNEYSKHHYKQQEKNEQENDHTELKLVANRVKSKIYNTTDLSLNFSIDDDMTTNKFSILDSVKVSSSLSALRASKTIEKLAATVGMTGGFVARRIGKDIPTSKASFGAGFVVAKGRKREKNQEMESNFGILAPSPENTPSPGRKTLEVDILPRRRATTLTETLQKMTASWETVAKPSQLPVKSSFINTSPKFKAWEEDQSPNAPHKR